MEKTMCCYRICQRYDRKSLDKEAINVVAKFIPKNTGGNLTSRMIFLGLRNIRWIVVSLC